MTSRLTNYFNVDNTEGYDQAHLDELNRRLIEAHGSEYSDCPDYDQIQDLGEKIATAYDTEISSAAGTGPQDGSPGVDTQREALLTQHAGTWHHDATPEEG